MSLDTMKRAWDHSTERGTKLVAILSLADRSDEYGVCWPGYDDTARRSRVERRRAIDIMQDLIDDGEVWMKNATTSTGRQTSNRYFVLSGLSSEQIREILITHPQLQVPPQDTDKIIKKIEERRQRRLDQLSKTHQKQIRQARAMRKKGGEGVDTNTPKSEGEGVDTNTGGCSDQHPGGVDTNTHEGVDTNTRTQRRTQKLTQKEPKDNGSSQNSPIQSSVQQLWERALRDLELSTDPAVFSQIKAAKIRSNGDDVCPSDTATIILSYRSPLIAEWMRERMSEHIEEALSAVAGEEVRVEFVAREEEVPA